MVAILPGSVPDSSVLTHRVGCQQHLRWCGARSVGVGSSLGDVDVTHISVCSRLINAAAGPGDSCSCTTLDNCAIKRDKDVASAAHVAVEFEYNIRVLANVNGCVEGTMQACGSTCSGS